MKTQRLEAIVLRRTNYGEADRVLQLLTPRGRRAVIAKGVRRERSKLAGGIELFAVCDVIIHHGHGSLGILTSARLNTFFRHILDDYDRMQFAYEVIKQIDTASSGIDEPEWFFILSEVLDGLNKSSVQLPLIKTWFYARYNMLLGEEINLQTDSAGVHLSENMAYEYDAQENSFRPHAHGKIHAEHIKLLRLIAAKPLLAVAQIGGVESVLQECLAIVQRRSGV